MLINRKGCKKQFLKNIWFIVKKFLTLPSNKK